jgi:hypothetical protein
LAGSLKLGHLKAAGVMRMLQVKDRPTTLAKALSELGRIIKTLHILRYIDDRPFRRRILFQLNRQELRHKLGRRVHHGDRGEIRSPLRQGQEEQLGSSVWPSTPSSTGTLSTCRKPCANSARPGRRRCPPISLGSRRYLGVINFLGRYDFSVPDAVANGGLRPLRQPNSEWDF